MSTIDIALVTLIVAAISSIGTLIVNALLGRRKATKEDADTLIEGYDRFSGRLMERMNDLEVHNEQQENDARVLAIEVRARAESLAIEVRARAESLAIDMREREMRIAELERHTAALQNDNDMTKIELIERDTRIAGLEHQVVVLQENNLALQNELARLRIENEELRQKLGILQRVVS